MPPAPGSTLFPYTTLFRSGGAQVLEGEMVAEPTGIEAEVHGGEDDVAGPAAHGPERSEEHTSELQSRRDLVCRLLLEKKNSSPHLAGASDTSVPTEGTLLL